jgi:hypothetical protein
METTTYQVDAVSAAIASVTANVLKPMTIEEVQKSLNRSRASIYRYANTHPDDLNPPYDPSRLNPEMRLHKDDPLLFHPNEVSRFAQDILRIKEVKIEVMPSPEAATQDLLKDILTELRHIRTLLEQRPS